MNAPIRIGILLAACVVVGSIFFLQKTRVPEPVLEGPLAVREAFWKERVSVLGSRTAYDEFASAVDPLSPAVRHNNAHAFGKALFAVEGVDGLSTCDDRFSYGCFHEFLGQAISALGLGVVIDLNNGCFKTLTVSPLSCQHGIGHGILAFVGYNNTELLGALEACRSLPGSDPIGGCYGGVFMEYNLQTMLAEEGRLRPIQDDVQAPCDSLEREYGPACYFWQPQWWHQLLLTQGVEGVDSRYARMGEWCGVTPQEYRRACFEGIGNNLAPDADFNGVRARGICEMVSENSLYQLYCKSYVANSLAVGGAGATGDALAVCEGLVGDVYTYCAAYAHNEANIANQLSLSPL